MKILVAKIHEAAASRPEGYAEDVLSRGVIEGDWLELSNVEYFALRDKYSPRPEGLGDMVAKFAQPVARVIDAVVGTNIKSCGGCAKRREEMNAMVPFKK